MLSFCYKINKPERKLQFVEIAQIWEKAPADQIFMNISSTSYPHFQMPEMCVKWSYTPSYPHYPRFVPEKPEIYIMKKQNRGFVHYGEIGFRTIFFVKKLDFFKINHIRKFDGIFRYFKNVTKYGRTGKQFKDGTRRSVCRWGCQGKKIFPRTR